MNRLALMLLATSLSAVPTLAADCKIGTQQTLTGETAEAVQLDNGEWPSSIIENAQPCSVDMLKGRGKVPADCGFGEYFGRRKCTATGQVQEAGLGPVLMVTSIKCSS